MRLSATKLGSIANSRSFGDQLFDLAGEVPNLDLNFAGTKTLDPRVTFTRASTGTFVGSDGLLRSAVTNLLLRSEEFDTTWTRSTGTGETAISTNSIASPFGPVTADLFTAVNSGAAVRFTVQSVSKAAAALTYTYSIYLKAKEITFATFSCDDGLGNGFSGGINLTTGATSGATVGTGATFSSVAAVPVGNGWYRCSVTGTSNSVSTVRVAVNFATSLTTGFPSVTVNASDGFYLWGAQLEQSSTAGEYIPTTSVINSAPRFDHNPTTGESLGLLVEEARTNLLLRSEEFDNASWNKALTTVSPNAISAPNGTTTADKLEETSGTGEHLIWQVRTGSSETLTLSVFCKQAERTRVRLGLSNFATEGTGAIYDLVSGTVVSTSASGVDYTNPSASISAFGNGWFRCVFTATKGIVNTTNNSFIETVTGTSFSFTGTAGSGIHLWGAQLEAGAFPTSYIPTTTATATRAADVASITGTAFSSWYNQTEGTVFAAGVSNGANGSGFFTLEDGSAAEYIRMGVSFSLLNFIVSKASGTQSDIYSTGTSFVFGSPFRGVAAYALNNVGLSLNGGSAQVDTTADMPSAANALRIGLGKYTTYANGTIRRLTYWPVRLADPTLVSITQP